MIYRPEFDSNGKKVLCEMNGVNSEMLMDIYVKKLSKGEFRSLILILLSVVFWYMGYMRIKTSAPFYCFRAKLISK